jgi:hypothetical protein
VSLLLFLPCGLVVAVGFLPPDLPWQPCASRFDDTSDIEIDKKETTEKHGWCISTYKRKRMMMTIPLTRRQRE